MARQARRRAERGRGGMKRFAPDYKNEFTVQKIKDRTILGFSKTAKRFYVLSKTEIAYCTPKEYEKLKESEAAQ
jgi:hypothetical protein